MTQAEFEPEPTLPRTPPMQPGAIGRPAASTSWPTVLGVILIVFGCGGVLGGMAGIASPFMQRWAVSLAQQQNPMQDVMERWKGWTIVSSLVALMIAAVLLTGGILLLKRRRRATPTIRLWALAKALYALVAVVVGYRVQQEIFGAMAQDPNMAGAPLGGTSFFSALGAVGIGLGLAWSWALPVFVLIWFARRRSREEMAGWP